MISTKKLAEDIKDWTKDDLKKQMHTIEKRSFVTYIQELMDEKQMSKAKLISKTNIQRNYGYQILDGSKSAGKDKIVQLCLGLECSMEQAQRLLALAQVGSLYAKNKRDALCIYALEHHLSVMDTNLLLEEFGLELLF